MHFFHLFSFRPQKEDKRNMNNPILNLVALRKKGLPVGIPSYCTANSLVLEALLEQGCRFNDYLLMEATANQVNQYGGYTGMTPADYRDYIFELAEKTGFPKDRILLGGDHLGPLTWSSEPETDAMEKAEELVRQFVLAGYKKIHLDTSMRLGDDDPSAPLKDDTIAKRGARLMKVCEAAYEELAAKNPDEMHPAYIIGSEVPIPGGSQEHEDSISVTKPEALDSTVRAYRKAFEAEGLSDAFRYIVGIVVQPGVEFGDSDVFYYNRQNAKPLVQAMKQYPDLVLEGHSTDYQTPSSLKEMAEDGIVILKVGPALTFSLREGLFALSEMEKLLIPAEKQANFIETLEETMLKQPGNWQKHYHGGEDELKIKRKFSFSDRCRYYFSQPEITSAIEKLFTNMESVEIPLNMLHQYMPLQYAKICCGHLASDPRSLVKDYVVNLAEHYNYATHINYTYPV